MRFEEQVEWSETTDHIKLYCCCRMTSLYDFLNITLDLRTLSFGFFDTDSGYWISKINYCPFCGEEATIETFI